MNMMIDFIYGMCGGLIIAIIWYAIAGARGYFK